MKNKCKAAGISNLIRAFLLFSLLIHVSRIQAQSGEIPVHGKITNPLGEPMQGVSVIPRPRACRPGWMQPMPAIG